jgi:hypothetical protein
MLVTDKELVHDSKETKRRVRQLDEKLGAGE